MPALAKTRHDKKDGCNSPPQGTETPPRSIEASNLEKDLSFDRIEDGDNHWVHGPLPPTLEWITAIISSDFNALKDAISMSGKERSRQRVKSFINELDRGTVSFTDGEFARLNRIVERRGRGAVHATVASIDTAQLYSPRPHSSETLFDARVYMEETRQGED